MLLYGIRHIKQEKLFSKVQPDRAFVDGESGGQEGEVHCIVLAEKSPFLFSDVVPHFGGVNQACKRPS